MNAHAAAVVLADVNQTSTGEAVQFWFLAIIAVLGGLGTVFAKRAVHSALSLAATMICLAVCYLAQGAYFLGIAQIVVYTGAVMMLFLFVLMLVGVDASDSLVETIRGHRWWALLASVGFGVLLVAGIANAHLGPFKGTATANAGGNVQELAVKLFSTYYWAFEITSALLITAAVGAMVLAHREPTAEKKTQRELSTERFTKGGIVTPLPSPGVYARHNAVDTPALLPDGSVAESSVSDVLVRRGDVRPPAAGFQPHGAVAVPAQPEHEEIG